MGKAASVVPKGDSDFAVEAALPLNALGLTPRPGLRLKGDCGILTSQDDRQVKARAYWSDLGAADEPTEARLEPHRWGRILFAVDPPRKLRGPELLGGRQERRDAEDGVLDALEER